MTKEQLANLESLLALAIIEEEAHEVHANLQGWKHIEQMHHNTRIALEKAWGEIITNLTFTK